MLGKIVPDEHYHEHATCYHVKVVISSCVHRGIVNVAKQAQQVSDVTKIHALVGGFHSVLRRWTTGDTSFPRLKNSILTWWCQCTVAAKIS